MTYTFTQPPSEKQTNGNRESLSSPLYNIPMDQLVVDFVSKVLQSLIVSIFNYLKIAFVTLVLLVLWLLPETFPSFLPSFLFYSMALLLFLFLLPYFLPSFLPFWLLAFSSRFLVVTRCCESGRGFRYSLGTCLPFLGGAWTLSSNGLICLFRRDTLALDAKEKEGVA